MIERARALYERDFTLWLDTQVETLRAGRWSDLDLANVIEELEALSRSERNAVKSQLQRLFLHLLKARFQPHKRTPSWDRSIDGAVSAIFESLADSPSLRPEMPAMAPAAYGLARRAAAKETRLARTDLPADLPSAYALLALALSKATKLADLDGIDALVVAAIDGPLS
jgi:hypothetical protein